MAKELARRVFEQNTQVVSILETTLLVQLALTNGAMINPSLSRHSYVDLGKLACTDSSASVGDLFVWDKAKHPGLLVRLSRLVCVFVTDDGRHYGAHWEVTVCSRSQAATERNP